MRKDLCQAPVIHLSWLSRKTLEIKKKKKKEFFVCNQYGCGNQPFHPSISTQESCPQLCWDGVVHMAYSPAARAGHGVGLLQLICRDSRAVPLLRAEQHLSLSNLKEPIALTTISGSPLLVLQEE